MRSRAAGVVAVLAAGLWLVAGAARAADAPALQGAWEATNTGGSVFRGTWTADVAVATPDVALGAWTMVDERGNAVMNGTWSARKAPRGWRGAWSARIAATNQLVSGTWDADDRTLKGAKTFRDMLARSGQTQIAGVWHMGRAHGTWWLTPRS